MAGPAVLASVFPERTQARAADIQVVQRRYVHRAKHGSAVFDQRDVHRELAIALHELARAVQRVHQPEARCRRRQAILGTSLLGHGGDIRRQRGEMNQDHALGALVGLGHGGVVGLAAHGEIGFVHAHDFRAGAAHDGGQRFEQRLPARGR